MGHPPYQYIFTHIEASYAPTEAQKGPFLTGKKPSLEESILKAQGNPKYVQSTARPPGWMAILTLCIFTYFITISDTQTFKHALNLSQPKDLSLFRCRTQLQQIKHILCLSTKSFDLQIAKNYY